MRTQSSILTVLIAFTLWATVAFSAAPFINFNEIHPTKSQFEFNLIVNQNRNTPIILVQFSENKTERIIRGIVQNALSAEPDIAFALFVDCRDFAYDLNHSLSLCKDFEEYQKNYVPKDEEEQDKDKLDDPYFGFDFFSPNPTRIREKGHILAKNHDTQNLRQLNVGFSGDYLAKVIRNQVPDLVAYIEDQRDLQDFLQIKSEFSLSKAPKLLYFDQNLQSPLFLKKLAVRLDGWFKIAVSDSPKIAAQFKSQFDSLILLEYDFQSQKYQRRPIDFNSDQALNSILENKQIQSYTAIRKPRDILLDFEHKEALIYNVTHLKQINQLISHGRIIILQISNQDNDFNCSLLTQTKENYQVLFNYVCLGRSKAANLLTAIQADPQVQWEGKLFFIDGSLKKTKVIKNGTSLYKELPQAQARQKITTQKESQMCVDGARATQRQPVLYYFNQKSHSTSLHLLKYFGSLQEVSSLLYFCQFLIPDDDVRRTYQLTENAIFTLTPPDEHGRSQKVEHKQMEDFFAIKMFLREVAIAKVYRVYEQRILNNEVLQIISSEELTERCFSHNCVIALIQTNTFHQESQLKMLKEMQIDFSDQPFKYYWIDGICHFQVAKQLKLIPKGSKLIQKSYLFLYNEKTYQYALWKGNKLNKFWLKKDVFRWVKSLRNPNNISKLKFGIDFQNKKCLRSEPKEKSRVSSDRKEKTIPKKSDEVNEDEL